MTQIKVGPDGRPYALRQLHCRTKGNPNGEDSDYGIGEFTYPRGWFVIADSDELKDIPLPVRYFGQDFVLYRGESGKPHLLDAYCPHMGAHLAINTTSYVVRDGTHVEGKSIRCPYHGWRFGPDGQCDDIPYYDKIPKSACVRSWPIQEKLGLIFVWYDAENKEPDLPIPDYAEWDDPAWVHWKVDRLGTLASHPQEILDNMSDVGHFAPTHGSLEITYFENEIDGTTLISVSAPDTAPWSAKASCWSWSLGTTTPAFCSRG